MYKYQAGVSPSSSCVLYIRDHSMNKKWLIFFLPPCSIITHIRIYFHPLQKNWLEKPADKRSVFLISLLAVVLQLGTNEGHGYYVRPYGRAIILLSNIGEIPLFPLPGESLQNPTFVVSGLPSGLFDIDRTMKHLSNNIQAEHIRTIFYLQKKKKKKPRVR